MFKKVDSVEQAYLKAGLFGFQGSGKTWTASELAIGLHKHIGSTKGVVFLDTETGSDFMIPKFKAAGIELYVDKTRAFADLLKDLNEARAAADIVIIDSITHFWREWVAAYKAKNRRTFIKIQDWGPLKEEWAKYSGLYVNSPLHIIMCGRAGNVFEDVVDGEEDRNGQQSWKAVKVGTKMAAETETGYEPSLLIEMTKEYTNDGGRYVRTANVIKERFGVIDSKTFSFASTDKPGFVFECFQPHIDLLNLGGKHVGFDASRTSESLMDDTGQVESAQRKKAKDIAIEEMEGVVVRYLPGQDAKSKKMKADLFQAVAGTTSWTAITSKSGDELRRIRYELEKMLKLVQANSDQLPDASDFLGWIQSELIASRQQDALARPN